MGILVGFRLVLKVGLDVGVFDGFLLVGKDVGVLEGF